MGSREDRSAGNVQTLHDQILVGLQTELVVARAEKPMAVRAGGAILCNTRLCLWPQTYAHIPATSPIRPPYPNFSQPVEPMVVNNPDRSVN